MTFFLVLHVRLKSEHQFVIIDFNFCNVFDVDRASIDMGDDCILDIFWTFEFSGGADDVSSFTLIEVTAAVISVFPFQGGGKLIERDAPRRQLGGVHDDLKLTGTATKEVGQPYAWNSLDLRFDVVVDEVVKSGEV